ncbi:MAG: rane protein [Myxococcaceae bacterium]|nr:rane protein [Myxococcaceae bacterium]
MDRYQSATRPWAGSTESVNDILWATYRWMSIGLFITGTVAWGVSHTPAALDIFVGNRLVFYGLMFAQLGLVIAFSSMAARVSTAAAAAMFFTYAALTGLTFSVLFLVYTSQSIAQTFFITGGSFAGLSVFGATTKRDLSPIGRFALFAVIGLIIASLVNMFLASSGLMFVTSCIGVLVFAALTAYDTQKLKQMYAASGGAGNLALRGALTLYLDFINMFVFLLNLTGRRK